eukprot:15451568-Alexandrium_andersonii.AAC.1
MLKSDKPARALKTLMSLTSAHGACLAESADRGPGKTAVESTSAKPRRPLTSAQLCLALGASGANGANAC